MLVHKLIYRLDYNLAYSVIDKLGEYLNFIEKSSNKNKYNEEEVRINRDKKSGSFTANINENDKFRIQVGLNSLILVSEYKKGIELKNLERSKIFKIFDELVKKIDVKKYRRVGIRMYFIKECETGSFNEINEKLWAINHPIEQKISKVVDKKEDIALIFEFENNIHGNCRLTTGPYKGIEYNKYFEQAHNVEEGNIIDIDLWQEKLVLDYSVMNNLKNKVNFLEKFIYNISEFIEE